ncbi:MAG: hypothetical protein WAM58_00035 [Candidatus Acidiferrum sp.]
MEETKEQESAYSDEPIEIAGPDSLRTPTAATESSGTEKAAWKQTQVAQKAVAPKVSQTRAAGTMSELPKFPKRMKRVWLIVAGAILGMIAVVTLVTRMSERTRNVGEKRQEQAMPEVIPENLIKWCGLPAEDVTEKMYPVVLRTMSYQRGGNEKIVFEFSRTAEAKSDWVLLSMKDAGGTKSFETQEAKIAALPCLDSMK